MQEPKLDNLDGLGCANGVSARFAACFITVVVAVLNGKWVSKFQRAWSTLVAVQREVHVYLDGSNMSAVNSAVCVNRRSNTSVPASHWGGQRSGSLCE